MGRVHVTMGTGMATFFMCAKIPIGRLDANEQREQLTIS